MHMLSRRRAVSLAVCSALAAVGKIPGAEAAYRANIDAGVYATLQEFYWRVRGGRELVHRAAGVLVFPTIIKAGFGIGGEYGEGALLVGGRTDGYYNCVSASIGFQFGAQARSVIIVFMTYDALDGFHRINGWKVGVDGSVAIITVGVGGSIDTDRIVRPVVGFIFDGKGLMYNLTLEGTKISRISAW